MIKISNPIIDNLCGILLTHEEREYLVVNGNTNLCAPVVSCTDGLVMLRSMVARTEKALERLRVVLLIAETSEALGCFKPDSENLFLEFWW